MIKIQIVRDSANKIKLFSVVFAVAGLVLGTPVVGAKTLGKPELFRITRTQIMTHKANPGEVSSAMLSKMSASGLKIVSANRDKTQFTTITTERPQEYRGFASGRLGMSGNALNPGRRFNRYTHKFNMMQLASAQGVITSSLAAAGQKAGLSEELMEQLAHIFAWDIDFATDLHNGDRFTVVYEKGGYNGADDIVAAEFVNHGKTFQAVRYIDSEGFANYYTPSGNALQKAFLSTPVEFARISSHFSLSRKHPVLNRIRAHKGVDYAARTGTPVKATGAGEIAFLGRKGGYGQVIIIKHGEHYETVYAHLSRYKQGLSEGSAVRQGEIIGYVGQTGLATGPHLHYEFRIDGVHQNPLTAQAANSSAVNKVALADFKSQTQDPLTKLNLIKANSYFVKNNSSYD